MRRSLRVGLVFWIFLLLAAAVCIAAMLTGLNLLFWVFGAMSAALILSWAVPAVSLRIVSAHRIPGDHAVMGEPFIVRYAVRHHGRFIPVFGLRIEELPTGSPDGWERSLKAAPAWVMHVGPGEEVHGEAIFVPARRGDFRFERMRLSTDFPFGLLRFRGISLQSQRLRVWPQVRAIRRGFLTRLIAAGPTGMRAARRAGRGEDFFGLREYRPGDELRHVAWKRTAHRDPMLVIDRSPPAPPRLRLVLRLVDAQGARAAGSDAEEAAISLAASLAAAADADGFEVGLTILGFNEQPVPLRRGARHCARIMSALAAIDLESPRIRATEQVRQDQRESAGIVVVHPGSIDPTVVPEDAIHLSSASTERIYAGSDPLRAEPAGDGMRASAPPGGLRASVLIQRLLRREPAGAARSPGAPQ